MSYYLAVFDPDDVPCSKPEFRVWFRNITEWDLSRSYDNPDAMTPKLRAWFDEVRVKFPPMNGPLALSDEAFDALGNEAVAYVTDYSIDTQMVYAAFAWSVAEEAEWFFHESALRRGLGFYDPQSDLLILSGRSSR